MLNWSEIRGQERAKGVLDRAVTSSRVHHAYLFVGLEGIGKFTTALALARILNCKGREESEFREACGECSSCRKIDRRQHPDLHIVVPEGATIKTIKIAQIREVQKIATTRPYEGRFQIVLLDDCHLMTDEASNALLKTLEEPPSTMRLILVTDQPHRLLDTIISRCQRVRFGALPVEDVAELLRENLAELFEEDAELPPEDLIDVAAGFGEGSVGRASRLLVSGVLEDRREVLGKLAEIDPSRPRELLDMAKSLSGDRAELAEKLDLLKVFFRDVMLRQTTGGTERIINTDLEELVERVASSTGVERVLDQIDRISTAQKLLLRNVNARLITEELLLHLVAGVEADTGQGIRR